MGRILCKSKARCLIPAGQKNPPLAGGYSILKTGNMKGCRSVYYKQFCIWFSQKLLFLYEGQVYDLLHGLYIVKLYPFDKAALDLIHVFFILPAENDLF